jgi:hypothetical protein
LCTYHPAIPWTEPPFPSTACFARLLIVPRRAPIRVVLALCLPRYVYSALTTRAASERPSRRHFPVRPPALIPCSTPPFNILCPRFEAHVPPQILEHLLLLHSIPDVPLCEWLCHNCNTFSLRHSSSPPRTCTRAVLSRSHITSRVPSSALDNSLGSFLHDQQIWSPRITLKFLLVHVIHRCHAGNCVKRATSGYKFPRAYSFGPLTPPRLTHS